MIPQEQIALFVQHLESASSQETPVAVLQSGVDVVECARLAANRAALYGIAAAALRATLAPGNSVSAGPLFRPESEYYLTEIVQVDDPVVVPEQKESTGIKVANIALAAMLIGLAALVIIGLGTVINWLI